MVVCGGRGVEMEEVVVWTCRNGGGSGHIEMVWDGSGGGRVKMVVVVVEALT